MEVSDEQLIAGFPLHTARGRPSARCMAITLGTKSSSFPV